MSAASQPVYDGRLATGTAEESGDGLDVRVESQGVLCATGHGSLPDTAASPPRNEDYQQRIPPAERPPADETSLAAGTWLGIQPLQATTEAVAQYLRDVREVDPVYAEQGLVHPGQLLRLANLALRENVVLQPWIHTGSKIANFADPHRRQKLTAAPASTPTTSARATAWST
jgi:hypothetical protein